MDGGALGWQQKLEHGGTTPGGRGPGSTTREEEGAETGMVGGFPWSLNTGSIHNLICASPSDCLISKLFE